MKLFLLLKKEYIQISEAHTVLEMRVDISKLISFLISFSSKRNNFYWSFNNTI